MRAAGCWLLAAHLVPTFSGVTFLDADAAEDGEEAAEDEDAMMLAQLQEPPLAPGWLAGWLAGWLWFVLLQLLLLLLLGCCWLACSVCVRVCWREAR